MELDRSLLKEFAKITDNSEQKTENKYLRGTIVTNSGGKYVQLDGSSTVTPISEIIDVEEGDRVLVTIENHKATIVGNFTFPPSARKEQEALNKANNAQSSADNANSTANTANDTANAAQQKAQEASDKAETAIDQSSIASASANEAKTQATDAINKAETASTNATEAKTLATEANTAASEAKTQAAESQASTAEARAEITRLENEVSTAQGNIDQALEDLESQAEEITGIKRDYSLKTEVNNAKAELSTEITEKVGELETKITKDYSTKTENVELEGRLQTQITQNAEGFASQATKIEKLESDTTEAQKDVADALAKASAAQTSATEAQTKADAAQEAADTASANAQAADEKAELARNAADTAQAAANAADKAVQEAKGDLDEAKVNLASVTSRVDATEADIAEAQGKVDAAQKAVDNALEDAAEANAAANKAQTAADKAQQDAETAQGAATTAQQKADNAKTAADNAQSAAEQAQADVAALTNRVITAETNITQNSTNITLNANKTTEIGNKVDNLPIGGRNLIFGSKTQDTSKGNTSNNMTKTNDTFKTCTVFRSYQNWAALSTDLAQIIKRNNLQLGDTITHSIWVKNTDTVERTYMYFGSSSNNTLNFNATITKGVFNEWTQISHTYSITQKMLDLIGVEEPFQVRFSINSNNTSDTYVYWAAPKLELGTKPTDWSPAPEDVYDEIENVSDSLTDYVDGIKNDLQGQIDNSIVTWFYSGEPTLNNVPSSDWTTTELKEKHIGDLYYDKVTGYCYRFMLDNETSNYIWIKIADQQITEALQLASDAQDTADNKRQVFVDTATVPYEIGDLLLKDGLLYTATTQRLTGSYTESDWEVLVNYTDDTAVNNLQIGGRNLVLGTSDEWTDISVGRYNGVVMNRKHCSEYGLNVGDTFTYSLDIKVINKTSLRARLDFYSSVSGEDGKTSLLSDIRFTNGNEGRSYLTATVPEGKEYITLYISNFHTGSETTTTTEQYRKVKLEKGNKPTDWTPAPEDIYGEIDNIQIGGRNLILGSRNQDTSMGINIPSGSTETSETFKTCKVFTNAAAWSNMGSFDLKKIILLHNLKLGDIVTHSVWMKNSDTVSRKYMYYCTGNYDGGYTDYFNATIAEGVFNDWTRLEHTYEITQRIMNAVENEDITKINSRFQCTSANTSGTYRYWAAVKLELGNKATDWTPAPEDIENELHTNYYNKVETDAKIQVESDRITSTVTETITTIEENINKINSNIELIIGTQTAATGSWTGIASLSSLTDGQQITYWLPYAGSGNATLNLTLSDGSTTGAIPCYYGGTSRITTHYPAGSVIRFVYRENVTIGSSTITKGFWADANYDSNNYDRVRFNNSITAKSAITAGQLIVGDDSGFFKLVANTAFDITKPILYAASNISASSTGSNNYLAYPSINLRNTLADVTLTNKKTCYIVGTIVNNKFTPNSTLFTTTEPTSEDGLTYIALGLMVSTYQIYLYPEHPIYRYMNGGFKSSGQIAYEAQYTADNIDVGGRNLILGSRNQDTSKGNLRGAVTETTETYKSCIVFTSTQAWSDIGVNLKTIIQRNNLKLGDVITHSVWMKNSDTVERQYRYYCTTSDNQVNFNRLIKTGVFNDWVRLSLTYEITQAMLDVVEDETVTSITSRFECTTNNTSGTYVYWAAPKLELGNKATDWSPAPEDVDTNIASVESNLGGRIDGVDLKVTTNTSRLEQLADLFAHIVVNQDGGTMLEQTNTGYTFNMYDINNGLSSLNTLVEKLEKADKDAETTAAEIRAEIDALNEKNAYVSIGQDDNGNPCIELGKADSDFKVRITNTAIDFMQGPNKLAYANNNTFYTTKLIVKNELQIGEGPGFVWRTRANGNMGLVYIS